MRRILVVANQTLASHDLMTSLRERAQRNGELDVYVVVPASDPATDHWLVNLGQPPGGGTAGRPPADGFELAQRRLEKGLVLIGAMGVRVAGEVGDSDPMRAVGDAFKRLTFDEVMISTLPHDVSHWLRSDLSARVHRKHHVPVTTVTARHHANA